MTPRTPPTRLNVVIGLGANLGDRLATMRAAVARIAEVATLRACSRVYATAPVGVLDQPVFLNAAIAVESTLAPDALLDVLLATERELGRVRDEDAIRWGPRRIDLDILWIDGLLIDSARLTVPHPRLAERAFALVPFLEVAPGAIDPRSGLAYAAPASPDVQLTDLRLA